jgi:plastocyanin
VRIGLIAAAVLAVAGLGLLVAADAVTPGDGSQDAAGRLDWAIHSGDHLHFAGHVAAGRLLDVCPCTRGLADGQYYRAHFHAVTPLQLAVAATTRPHSPAEWTIYVGGPLGIGRDWLGDGLAWLSGQRPGTRQVIVDLDQTSLAPGHVRITPGTTVIWRNVDLAGVAHTVSASDGGAFASDQVAPGRSFSHTFTQPGDYAYVSRGGEDSPGAALTGLVSVR